MRRYFPSLLVTLSSIAATFALVSIMLLMPYDVHAQSLRSVEEWERGYPFSSTETAGMVLARSGDNGDIYPLGLYLDGATAMWRATGKTVYLDQALRFVNTTISTAIPSSQIANTEWKTGPTSHYLSWPGFGGTLNGRPKSGPYAKNNEFPLHESYMWRYVTALLRAMRATPSVYNDPGYRAQYDKILAFTEKNIWEKWYVRSINRHLYRENAHMASHWAFIAMNLYVLTSDPVKREQYKTIWENIDHKGMPVWGGISLKNFMKPNPRDPGAHYWTVTFRSLSDTRPTDSSHASAVVSYAVASFEYGNTDWNLTDMAKFMRTYDIIVPGCTYGLDGSGVDGWGGCNINDGWVKLGRFSPAHQRKVESHSRARGAQYYGNGALNAKILLGGGGGGGTPQCGNNVCEAGESRTSCPADCGGEVACQNAYTNSSAIPSGYGASYNLFSSSKELLVKGKMCSDTSYGVEVGSGGNQYVYKTGYQWTGSQWQSVTLTSSSQLQSNLWYTGSATFTATPRTGGTYVVGYVCQQVGNAWKCGCKDTTCATNHWQLQRVSR